MWLIQRKPLDETWRMQSSLILDIPSINSRGSRNESRGSAAVNVGGDGSNRSPISIISSAEFDEPPNYLDAMNQSRPISHFLEKNEDATINEDNNNDKTSSFAEIHPQETIDKVKIQQSPHSRINFDCVNTRSCLHNPQTKAKSHPRKTSFCLECVESIDHTPGNNKKKISTQDVNHNHIPPLNIDNDNNDNTFNHHNNYNHQPEFVSTLGGIKIHDSGGGAISGNSFAMRALNYVRGFNHDYHYTTPYRRRSSPNHSDGLTISRESHYITISRNLQDELQKPACEVPGRPAIIEKQEETNQYYQLDAQQLELNTAKMMSPTGSLRASTKRVSFT